MRTTKANLRQRMKRTRNGQISLRLSKRVLEWQESLASIGLSNALCLTCPFELLEQVILDLEPRDIQALSLACRKMHSATQDSHLRFRFIASKYDKSDLLFGLVRYRGLCNEPTIRFFCNIAGKVFSRHWCQVLCAAFTGRSPYWVRDHFHRKWGKQLSLGSFLTFMTVAREKFGDFVVTGQKQDGKRFERWLNLFDWYGDHPYRGHRGSLRDPADERKTAEMQEIFKWVHLSINLSTDPHAGKVVLPCRATTPSSLF